MEGRLREGAVACHRRNWGGRGMMSTESSIIDYYAARAREYERIYDKPERQSDLRRLRTIVEREFTGATVLEVACGTGYWTQVLARSAGSVFACDINQEVLAIARAKPVDGQRIAFTQADAYALPALPRPFTGGFAGFWWSHIPKSRIQSFLQGLHRLLSPGARVMFIDNAYVEGSSTPVSRTDEHGDSYQLRHLDDGSSHEVLKNFPTETELIRAVGGLAAFA